MGRSGESELSRRKKRLLGVLFAAVVMLLFVFGRVAYIKVVHGAEYQKMAEAQQVASTDMEIPALRGSIFDRNGNVLAESKRVYNIILDCQVLIEAGDSKQVSTMEQLVGTLGLSDDSSIRKYLTDAYKSYRYLKLEDGKGISAAQMEEIQEGIDSGRVVGIWFEEDESRRYVNDSLAAHVLGFNGTYGVEQYYDDELEGISGRKMVVAASGGSYTEEYIPAEDGNNLILTIDSKVEYNVEQILADAVEKTNAVRGAAILMNCKTGAIVAECEVPTYNLNNVTEVSGLSKEYQKRYPKTDPDYLPRIWNSWVISSTYEPGSTFKPIFTAAAMNEGVVGEKDQFYCSGSYRIYDAEVNCSNDEAHDVETVADILRNSCNIGMAQISERLPIEKWLQYQDAFGLGSLTGIDISGEAGDSKSLIYISPKEADLLGMSNDMGPFEEATTSFGQGFRVTPIQQICAFNSVINGGEYLKPYVVSEIRDSAGNTVNSQDKQVLRHTVSGDVSAKIRTYLEGVVTGGTGMLAQVPGYRIGGKTGTAEKIGDDGKYIEGKYIVSFLSFTPIEDPQYIMLVILDETASNSSHQIALLSGQIWESILPAMGMYPDPSINKEVVSPSTIDIRNFGVADGSLRDNDSTTTDPGADGTSDTTYYDDTNTYYDDTTYSDDTTTYYDDTSTYDDTTTYYDDTTDGDTTYYDDTTGDDGTGADTTYDDTGTDDQGGGQ